jgi:hypothetical protein
LIEVSNHETDFIFMLLTFLCTTLTHLRRHLSSLSIPELLSSKRGAGQARSWCAALQAWRALPLPPFLFSWFKLFSLSTSS